MNRSVAPTGLRERKRRDTRARLEEAAAILALRDGLEAATVEAISERAGVSPRTFFNYFDGKEDAVLGVREVTVDEATVETFLAGHQTTDRAESVVGLLFAVFGPALADTALYRTRMELLRRYPHLLARRMDQMIRTTQQLTAAVQTLLTAPAAPPVEPAVAEAVLNLCTGAIRVALRERVTAETTPVQDVAPHGAVHDLELRTTTLVRTAIGTLR